MKYIAIFLALVQFGCQPKTNATSSVNRELPDLKETTPGESRQSIIQLICMGEKFEGKSVQATGYIVVSAEHTALYLNKESADIYIPENAVWLQLSDSQYKEYSNSSKAYATVKGLFSTQLKGHGSRFKGGIKNISVISFQN